MGALTIVEPFEIASFMAALQSTVGQRIGLPRKG
jgi:hypothetical protein